MESTRARSARLYSLVDLNGVRGCVTGERLDFHLPCTATEYRACQIMAHLSVWNEQLCFAQLQLRERPGALGQQLSLVSFQEPQISTSANHDKMHRAITLASWLLKTHRCVAELDVTVGSLHACQALVCNTHWGRSSLKVLKLNTGRFSNQSDLWQAISNMVHLEELWCTGYAELSVSFSAALSTLLASTSSLSTLRVYGMPQAIEAVVELLRALSANTTLRKLSLPSYVAYPRAFIDSLSANHLLTTLIVVACGQRPSSALANVLHGLQRNRTISKLRLENFPIDALCGELVLKFTANNEILRSFEVLSLGCKVVPLADSLCGRWLEEVAKNETLELLTLPLGIFQPEQWEALFILLTTSRALKMVTIEVRESEWVWLPQVCRALTESGAERKVNFSPSVGPINAEVLACQAVSNVEAAGGIYCLPTVIPLLPSCTHVTSVRLLLEQGGLNDELSSAIATYIGASRTLRQLRLTSYESRSNSAWGVVINSLFQNVSIRELALDTNSMCIGDVELLADAVKSSQSISRVSFKTRWLRRLEAFLRALAVNISDNYRLLCVSVSGPRVLEAVRDWFDIWDTTRRNSDQVARAARFVSGAPCGRYCARALERVLDHPCLSEEIAKLASVSETEASAMARRCLGDMQPMLAFMRLAGVVRDELVFDRSGPPGPRLDLLNEDCWRHVRSFLKLDDVKD